MATTQRARVLGLASVLLLSGFASGQQERAKGGDKLVLKERRVEVTIAGNIAIIRHVFKVSNPADRMMEGRVTLDLPEGAVACDLSLLRNIASTDRRAKIMSPAQASAFYDIAKRRDLSLEEVLAPDALLAGPAAILPGPKGGALPAKGGGKDDDKEDDSSTEPEREKQHRKDKDVKEGPKGPPEEPRELPKSPPLPRDPAILEATLNGFRLRFFPVPAYGEETITAVFAVEVRKAGSDHQIEVPLAVQTSFASDPKVDEKLSVYVASDRPLLRAKSRSHEIVEPSQPRPTRHLLTGIDAKTRRFDLAYGLDAEATQYDVKAEVDWAARPARDPRGSITLDEAVTALRAAQVIRKTGEERAREIATIAGVVSRQSSLIVIESREVQELKDEVPAETAAPLAGADGCDYVRKAAGLPVAAGASCCERHVETTNNPERIAWAKREGLRTAASKELPNFTVIEFVRHRAGCAVKECRPSALRKAAEALKQ